ncbi:MAG: peptidylprolyl isomerase [Candidatus Margulisiibacteriota bacterium]
MLKFLRDKMKIVLIMVSVVFILTMFYGLGQLGMQGGFSMPGKGEGLARVNGKDVDVFRFNQIMGRLAAEQKGALDPMSLLYMQSMALSQLIDFTIIAQEGGKKFGANAPEVDRAVEDIMKANNVPDRRTFEQLLKKQGFSLENLKRMIREEIVVQKTTQNINSGVVLTPDDMREIRVQHILIKTAGEPAQKVLEEAKKGADFSGLAEKYSQDPGSASKGGDLGFFGKGAMVKEFEDTAYALKPGEISGLVKTDFGYHIIKMNESRLKENADKDKLLEEKKKNVFERWFSQVRAKSKVEIKNPMLSAFDLMLKGDLQGAAEGYKKAIKVQPESPYPHLFYGQLLARKGDLPLASQEYAKASSLASADPYLRLYIGQAYISASAAVSGEAAQAYKSSAQSEFERASALAGDSLEMRQSLAEFFKSNKLSSLLSEENDKIKVLKQRKKLEEELKTE